MSKIASYIEEALALYGASYANGRIVNKNGVPTAVTIVEKNRLQMKNATNDTLLYSGPKTLESVCHFVEKFWFWEQRPQ